MTGFWIGLAIVAAVVCAAGFVILLAIWIRRVVRLVDDLEERFTKGGGP